MADKVGKLEPSEELLNKVRHIPAHRLGLSKRMRNHLGETGKLRLYLSEQLSSFLSELDIRVSGRIDPGFFGKKHRLIYKVVESGAVCLEFTDVVRPSGAGEGRSLQAVHKYLPGGWEQKIDLVYQKCLDLGNDLKQALSLEEQLSRTEDVKDIVRLIEEKKEPKHAINLLLLGPNYDINATKLSVAYLAVGKVADAIGILEAIIQLYPEQAVYWNAPR